MIVYLLFIIITFIAYRFLLSDTVLHSGNESLVNKQKLKFTAISCFLLIIIIGLKDVSVGTDTERYLLHYLNDPIPDWKEGNVAGAELGFRYLEYWCNSIGFSWVSYSLLVSSIIVIPMGYFFYKYSDNLWASYMIYMTIGLFAMNMTGIRQSMACSMVVLGMIMLLNKKYFWFVISIILGYLFHYSAIIAFIIAAIPFIKYKSHWQLTLLLFIPLFARIGGDVLFYFIGSYMPERYDGYESQQFSMNPMLELMWISIMIFSYISLRRGGNVSQNIFSMYVMIVLFVSSIELSFHIYMAGRLSEYFETVIEACIPSFINRFPGSEKRLLTWAIYSLCILFFLIVLHGSDTLSISNYHFLGSGIIF